MKIFQRVSLIILLLTSYQYINSAGSYSIVSASAYRGSNIVDDLMEKMTVREKLAQLFIVSFSGDARNRSTIEAIKLIETEKIGGLIIMNSGLTAGARMINHLQSLSQIPLLVTIDGEWGASMRFDSIVPFPRKMQLGALQHDSLVYKTGFAIGEQVKRLGIQVNYAPTVDINSNPRNPVINTRSFGELPGVVALYGRSYMRGMRDAGVLGSAKHFPGHGDTEVDSHHALPLLTFTKRRIDSLELYPFRFLIEAGVDMVMIGHLEIPSLDSTGRPSSISYPIVTDLLRKELEYNGIIISDALNMKGVSEYMAPELLPLEAYKAGCDFILMPENVSEALTVMERAVERGEISMHSLNMRCKKMLNMKLNLGLLSERPVIEMDNLYKDLNHPWYLSLISQIAQNSVTLVINRDETIPVKSLSGEKFGYISVGGDRNGKEFAGMLMNYTHIDTIVLRGNYRQIHLKGALEKMSSKSHIIIAAHNTDARPQRDFGLNDKEMKMLTDFAKDKKVTFAYFGNPLAIPFLGDYNNFSSMIVGYSNTLYNNNAVAQMIFGSAAAIGRLPVTSGEFVAGHSLYSEGDLRISYIMPEDIGNETSMLDSAVSSLISKDIEKGLYTSAGVLLMKDHRVIYNKNFGASAQNNTFALNRMSGLLSTLPAILHLNQKGDLSLEDFAGKYLKRRSDAALRNVLISDLLMHRSPLSGSETYSHSYSAANDIALTQIAEQVTSQPISRYVQDILLDRAGMSSTRFIGDKIYTNTNDIAKYISIAGRGGVYGGVRIFDTESSGLTEQFMHYYSSSLNGSIVWHDNNSGFTLIYLNDKDEAILSESNRVITGHLLRRAIIDLLKL